MKGYCLFILFLATIFSIECQGEVYTPNTSKEPVCCIEQLAAINNLRGVSLKQKLLRLDKLSLNLNAPADIKCRGKLNYLKGNYHRIIGDYDSANLFIGKAYEVFNTINDSIAIAETKNLEGTINLSKGKYEKALTLFIEALNFGEHNRDSLWTAVVNINIGNLYMSRNEYQKSLKYFTKTYDVYKNTDEVFMKIKVLNNLGSSYQKLGRLEEAEQKFYDALAYARQEVDSFSISFVSQNIGHLLIEKKDFDLGYKYLEEAMPLADQQNDSYGVAYCLLGMGMGYYGQEKYGLAIQKLNATINLASKISANDLLQNAYKHLYKIDSNSANYSKALMHYQKFKALQDSAIWLIKNKSTEEILAKFEAKQKEKDNEILQAKNSLQNERLTKQSYIMGFVIITLIVMAVSFRHTRKINRLLIKNAQTVELQKSKLEIQAQELHVGNKVTQEINANLEKIVEIRTLKINQQNTALRNYEFENSHSVRGPLARILGLISLFEVEKLSKDQQLLVGRIDDSAKELDDIVKNMSKILGKA